MFLTYIDWQAKLVAILALTLMMLFTKSVDANDRVFIDDLQGIWFEKTYLDALRATKQPHQAEKKSKPVLIVFDVEPGDAPNSYRLVLGEKNVPTSADDVVYVWFEGRKAADGQFRILEIKEPLIMDGKLATYERVGKELGPIINSIVLSGEYRDQEGEKWVFTDSGKASFPGKSEFYFEASLMRGEATCDYIEAEDMKSATGLAYYGFEWTATGTLQLFEAKLNSTGDVTCLDQSFAELTPM